MARYDPEIIQEFADRLYSRAAMVVYRDTLIGTAAGFALGLVLHRLLNLHPDALVPFAVAGGVVGGGLGWVAGNDKAFSLRLEAQVALCQLQIERNTRGNK